VKKLALIGHSQAVALLDALGDWRPSATLNAGDDVHRQFGLNDTFKGWTTCDTGNNVFTFTPREKFRYFSGIQVCLISGGTKNGDLCTATALPQGGMKFDPSLFLLRFIERMANVDVIVSAIRGSFYVRFRRFLIANEFPEYDVFPYDEGEFRQPIDRKYIDDIIRAFVIDCCYPLAVMRQFLKDKTIIHIPQPPPVRDLRFGAELGNFGNDIGNTGVLRHSLRLKLHLRYMEILKETLAQYSVTYLDQSYPSALDEGFLRPEFADGMTHASARYGELVAEHLVNVLENS